MICKCKACNEPIDFETQNFIADDDGDYMHFACYCQLLDPEFFDKEIEFGENETEAVGAS